MVYEFLHVGKTACLVCHHHVVADAGTHEDLAHSRDGTDFSQQGDLRSMVYL